MFGSKLLCIVHFFFIIACNIESYTAQMTTLPGQFGEYFTTTPSPDSCENGMSPAPLQEGLTTFKSKPVTSFSNFTSFQWKNYGKLRPQVEIKICDFTVVLSVSFHSRNIKSSGVFVDGQSYYGAVDSYGNVKILTGSNAMYSAKTGWDIKIVVTPKNYSQTVEILDLKIDTCQYGYDCFEDCAMYVVDSYTGCKQPICVGDPCDNLSCPEGQECRLIDNQPIESFPSLMTPGVQLWDCVDKGRKDYGCSCKKYGVGEYKCPTCHCTT